MSGIVATSSLVGREHQRTRLLEWVSELADGSTGRAVLIEGEAGIGKSVLARSAAAAAKTAGCQVFWSACEELSRAFPLLPILEALGVRAAGVDPRRAAIVETLRAGWAPGAAIDRVT